MTVTTMDKGTVRSLAIEMEQVLQAWAKTKGITLQRAGGSFDPEVGEATLKVKIAIAGAAPAMVKDFHNYGAMYGLTADMIGRTFRHGARTYTIEGLALKSRVRPVITRGSDGKEYRWPADTVVKLLA